MTSQANAFFDANMQSLLGALPSSEKAMVLVHGEFHAVDAACVRALAQAKRLGGTLVVAALPHDGGIVVPSDAFAERLEVVRALGMVDHVFDARGLSVMELIDRLKPIVYVTSAEVIDDAPRAAIEAYGGAIVQMRFSTAEDRKSSTSHQPVPSKAAAFLGDFSRRHSLETTTQVVEKASSLSVLLVGEAIVDEYHYCEAMGKAGKEPILAVRYESSERFAGGVLSTANQVAEFSGNVSLVSVLGAANSQEDLIRQHLKPQVDAAFFYQPDAPTTVKRRYVEKYPLQKLFEVYTMVDAVPAELSQELQDWLTRELPRFDVVIVTDYGHGLLTPAIIDTLCARAKFLSVNTQTNASNHGFNTISKYPRADFVCISEKEFRIEARSRTRELPAIMEEVALRLGAEALIATRGERGSTLWHRREGFATVPAFTERIVDRIGAGDAVLALTSLAAAQQAPIETVGFLGNALGALAVETVGHRKTPGRDALMQKIDQLFTAGKEYQA